MKNMKSSVYAFILLLLLSSCAEYSNRMITKNKTYLTDNDFLKLEGTYDLFPEFKYAYSGKREAIDTLRIEAYNLNFFISSNEMKYNISEKYNVDVKFINKNRIRFITQKDNIKIDTIELGGKLRNGLFYLDNKYLKRNGIPYIFGGYTHHKTRIGLSKNNGLLLNYAYDNSGALLLIIGAGSSYNVGLHYKRIEK